MSQKHLFICSLLQRREMGFLHRNERQQFINASIHLADKLLVHNNEIKTIPCIDDRSRSSYMADANNNGIAAMTHSNRCISLIDTSTMKRIGEINGLTRTVWTLCFHPFDSNLLATGCLGGTVCVFRKTELIQSQTNEDSPITSISFHPKEPVIFYSIENRIVVWNYEENVNLTELLLQEEARIKYIKYNPSTDMLITGIRREIFTPYLAISDEPDENDETRLISCSSFLDHLMRALNSIVENMGPSSFINLEYYWSHILMQIDRFIRLLESSAKVQIRPTKFIGDFNISLALLQRRVHQIARILFQCDTYTTNKTSFFIDRTLEAIRYILKMYKKELKQFGRTDDLLFSTLADIIVTVQKILNLNNLPDLIRKNMRRPEGFQFRLQAWNINCLEEAHLPDFTQDWRNLITNCYIHNDSNVDISKCGKFIASFEVADQQKVIAIHSLDKLTLGDLIHEYTTDIEEPIMSLSFSPSSQYLLVGVRSDDIFGCFLKIDCKRNVRQNIQNCVRRNSDDGPDEDATAIILNRSPDNSDVISYMKWSARSGDGIIIGYKTYQLRCLIRR